MARSFFLCALVVTGLWLVVVGVQKWFDNRAVGNVVHAYMAAVSAGDRERILGLLQPEQRARVEEQTKGKGEDAWSPEMGIDYRIHHISIKGSHAEAKLWIEKEGYVVQPVIHLFRSETTRWKVGHIDQLKVDPIWEDQEQQRSQSDGRQMAEELEKAFEGKPGISVERVPFDNIPGAEPH